MVSSSVTCTHNTKPFLLTFPSPLQSPNPQMYLMKHFKTYFHSVWPKLWLVFPLLSVCICVWSASNCQCVQTAAVPQSEMRYHKLWVLTAGSLLPPPSPSVPAAHTCTWTWGHLIQTASVWLWKQQVTKPNQRRCRLKKRRFNQNQPIIAEEP